MTNNRKLKRQNITSSPELEAVTMRLSLEVSELISFLEDIDPELDRIQSTYLAADIIKNMPRVFQMYPETITQIKSRAQTLKSQKRDG
ncbi:hypothetical protein [Calothrix sp. PCC 7507]|uniref:hypothetical protein n=1 Tax=Calothrix sp. PCC 7507 TaxID=99598 RepID=UPI00029F43D4|nr:hypothetical protein [Calothrix sp. PCC 7507]AFY31612.1 hypothetical protein Cal7507_1138 [Calothrix sp. PCC 7507]